MEDAELAVVLALMAAVGFGVGMTLQQHDARQVPFGRALHASVLVTLLQRPIWLAGVAASGVAFLVQLAALHVGTVVVVQPIVTSSLVVCLALTSWWRHCPLGAGRWMAIASVVFGLFVFLRIASPRASTAAHVAGSAWLVETVVVAVVVVWTSRLARVRSGLVRGIGLGVAAGVSNAYVASLGRGLGLALERGFVSALGTPFPYALVAAAAGAVLLVQAIYQAGAVNVSLPVATVCEAVGSMVLGVAVLGERPVLGGGRGVVALIGFSAAAAGLVVLARAEAQRLGPDADREAASRS
jgi:hypothetical protein